MTVSLRKPHRISCASGCEHMVYDRRTNIRTYPPTAEYLRARPSITTRSVPTPEDAHCYLCDEDRRKLYTTATYKDGIETGQRTLCGPCIQAKYL